MSLTKKGYKSILHTPQNITEGSQEESLNNSKSAGRLNKGKKTSRSKLRVRSNSSVFKTLNKTDSKVLEDPNESFDYLYKFIIIGDENVGKSNLMLRICKGIHNKKPKTTYGVEFEWKTFPLPNSN
jgi:hypothetical protein